MKPISLPVFDYFTVNDFLLECGAVLQEAKLAYCLQGDLRKPAVVTCTAFAQTYDDLLYLRRLGGALSLDDYCLIHTELLGNGRSSSPSLGSLDGTHEFPSISIADNVRLQKLCLDHLGITHVTSVIGASMGGQQALQWAVSYPTMMDSIVVIVGSAQATLHVQLFLHSLAQAIRCDPNFKQGRYQSPPLQGLAQMSEYWAAWAFSPQFFSQGHYQLYEDTQASGVNEFLKKWRTRYFTKDANNLLCHLMTWAAHDVSKGPAFNGNLKDALGSIQASVLYLPCNTDAYFSLADIEYEASLITDAKVSIIDSINGHAAGFGRSVDDQQFINREIDMFLKGQF